MLTCFCFISDEGLFEHQFSFKNNKKNVNIQLKEGFFELVDKNIGNGYFSIKYLL